MDAGMAFVVCGSFDPVHVASSWKMVMGKFYDENLALFARVSSAFPGTS